MPVEIRPLDPDRFAEWRRVTRRGFGDIPPEADIERRRRLLELDRCFAAMEGGRVVGTGNCHTFRMTVPGGGSVPAAGIAAIATAATHARRGVMTSMISELFRQARERGETIAALCPSESSIYGRFGFGCASFAREISIQTADASLRPGSAETPDANYVDRDAARKLLPKVWDRAAALRSGWLDRSPQWWEYLHFDDRLQGARGPFFIVSGNEAEPDGYVIYTTTRVGNHGESNLDVRELVATSDAARRSLWRLVLGIDLAGAVSCLSTPVDDPLWWMLADPRKLASSIVDGVWARLLDIPEAMGARSYRADGKVTIEVVDSFDPASTGTFVLETAGGRAECRPATGSPDLVMGAAELAAAYLGGAGPNTLAAADRIQESRNGAADLLDRMLSTSSAPWCPHEF